MCPYVSNASLPMYFSSDSFVGRHEENQKVRMCPTSVDLLSICFVVSLVPKPKPDTDYRSPFSGPPSLMHAQKFLKGIFWPIPAKTSQHLQWQRAQNTEEFCNLPLAARAEAHFLFSVRRAPTRAGGALSDASQPSCVDFGLAV